MSKPRKHHSPEFKLKAVIEVLKKEKTAAQIAGELGVHPMALSQWKKHFLEHGVDIFAKPRCQSRKCEEKEKVKVDPNV